MSSRIEDYALIGDCETAALVSRDGSVDWVCWPRFDSGASFAALLGGRDHGRWQLIPAAPVRRVRRRYRDGTLILETEYETDSGAVALVDFMPPRGVASDLVRMVVGRRGQVPMRMELIIRFDYGALVPWVSRADDGTFRAVAGPDMLVLRTPVQIQGKHFTTVAEFTVSEGETVPFAMTYGPSHLPMPAAIDPHQALADTEQFWREWSSRCRPAGEWSEVVKHSLIVLKALTYRPTGGIVAAPTSSLPEQIGGPRNWDYRFCWLRDSTFTLMALMEAGYYDEARAWRDWLLRAVAGSPNQIQIMYGLAGERRLTELEVTWLPGYEGSLPVRIGNAAYRQLQLDVFGEVMDALHQGRKGRLAPNEAGWQLQLALIKHLEKIWREPDQGLWEMRGEPRQFTHSKVMAWVAVDRAVKSVEAFSLNGPVDRWRELRRGIHEEICEKGFNPKTGTFVQSYGGAELDASLLMLPLVGFLPPDDPRIRGTVEAIERNLMADGFVLRYDTRSDVDGLPAGEGAFLACSFWLADNLTLLGRHEEARDLFQRLLALRNDVGLLAEEYDPRTRRMLGNFPQAFSHVSLVNTARNLTRNAGPAEHRAQPDQAGRHAG